MKKKLMSLVLAMTMLLSALPAAAAVNTDSSPHNISTENFVIVENSSGEWHRASTAYSANTTTVEDLGIVAEIVLTDLTGTTQKLMLSPKASSNTSIATYSNGEKAMVAVCEAFVKMDGDGISLLEIDGGSKTKDGVKATIEVEYTVSADREYIKVKNFSGSWVPSNNLYYLTDRDVGVFTGGLFAVYSLNKQPTSNSFNYSLNWDYTGRYFGDYCAKAYSDAKIWVAGMENSGPVTISVTLNYDTEV